MEKTTGIILGIIIAFLVINTVLIVNYFGKDKEIQVPSVNQSDLNKVVSDAVASSVANIKIDIPAPVVQAPQVPAASPVTPAANIDDSKVQEMYDVITEEKQQEKKALELALEEIDSRDFQKSLVLLLNDNDENVENYKDIKSVVVQDSDVDVNGDSADVELELKVTYYNDGDTDSEDAEKAKVKVTLSVEDLVFDDNFVDAEANYDDEDLTLVKLYE